MDLQPLIQPQLIQQNPDKARPDFRRVQHLDAEGLLGVHAVDDGVEVGGGAELFFGVVRRLPLQHLRFQRLLQQHIRVRQLVAVGGGRAEQLVELLDDFGKQRRLFVSAIPRHS